MELPSEREVSPKVTIGACEGEGLMMGSALFIRASSSRAPSVSHPLASSLPEGAYTPTTKSGQSDFHNRYRSSERSFDKLRMTKKMGAGIGVQSL